MVKCLERSHQNVKSGSAIVKLVRGRLHHPLGQFPVGELRHLAIGTSRQKHMIKTFKKWDF